MQNVSPSFVPENVTKLLLTHEDYILFGIMLTVSTAIGIYFGYFSGKQTQQEYLTGGKKMKVLPVSLSALASNMSAVAFLAVPADVYRYGANNLLFISLSIIVSGLFTIYLYLPVIYNLKVTSSYEYLERRFDSKTRIFVSFLYTLNIFLYLPIVAYVPILAFSTGSRFHFYTMVFVVCSICIFYTAVGGFKAVVWTDVLQLIFFLITQIAILILGIQAGGGFKNIWRTSVESERILSPEFNFDPTLRDSFWIIVLGYTQKWIYSIGFSQTQVQKYLSVKSLRDAKKTVIYHTIGVIIIMHVSFFIGLIMYAKYEKCDPVSAHHIAKNDQIASYFVMQVAQNIPGLTGIFMAGVFSASLSTISASLNAVSATIYDDFIKKIKKLDSRRSQKSASVTLKVIVIVFGICCTLFIFVIEKLEDALAVAVALGSVTYGPLLGVFYLGLIFPKANAKGAFYGSVLGLLSTTLMVFPAKYYQMGKIQYEPKLLSIDECVGHKNMTPVTILENGDDLNFIFRISHYYYALIGVLVTCFFGLLISYMTNKKQGIPVDKSLISPLFHFMIDEESTAYSTVDQALNVVRGNQI